MKTEAKEKEGMTNKNPEVIINPELDKYYGKILFPKKLELAEKQLKGINIEAIRKHRR